MVARSAVRTDGPRPLDDVVLEGITGGGNGPGLDLASPSEIFHAAFSDTVVLGDGNDRRDGKLGDDSIKGEGGNDTLNGNTGDDLLEGGTGDDKLVGGWGDDTFVYNPGNGSDTVNGHRDGGAERLSGRDVDSIVLNGLDWDDVRIEFSKGGFVGDASSDGTQKLHANSAGVIHIGDQRIEFRGIERIQLPHGGG